MIGVIARRKRGTVFDTVFNMILWGHRRLTLPLTVPKPRQRDDASPEKRTYVVCLDCGKEFAFNWEELQLESTPKTARPWLQQAACMLGVKRTARTQIFRTSGHKNWSAA
jgi:hypothetical protein